MLLLGQYDMFQFQHVVVSADVGTHSTGEKGVLVYPLNMRRFCLIIGQVEGTLAAERILHAGLRKAAYVAQKVVVWDASELTG